MNDNRDPPKPTFAQNAGHRERDMIESFEIFPWTDEFETGIDAVDEQHRTLVRLLNSLARSLAVRPIDLPLQEILGELTEYTVYHFDSEEQLMRQCYAGDALETGHRHAHREFVRKVGHLIELSASRPANEVIEEIVAFLSRWLAYHILDSDRRMAKVVLAVRAGISIEEAKSQVDMEMSGTVKVLIDAVLGMYEKLSSRTFQLMKEVVERKNIETQLRRAATVFANALEPIFATDERHMIIDGNASFCDLAGRPCEALAGTPLEDAIPSIGDESLWPAIWQAVQAQGLWRGEIVIRVGAADPSPGWMTLSAINDEYGAATHYVGVLSNITQLISRQQQLERLAHHDALTGLPNRLFLNERIRQAMAQARRNGELLAVCYIDLDGFKEINDRFGHGVGDRLLQEIASRCQASVRGNDTVARLGGDEFVILLGDLKRPEDCTALLDRLLAEVQRPLPLDGQVLAVTASIGVTLFPSDDADPDALLHHADLAMYRAKQGGKGRYQMY